MLGQVMLISQARLSQVRLCQLGQVRLGQVMLGWVGLSWLSGAGLCYHRPLVDTSGHSSCRNRLTMLICLVFPTMWGGARRLRGNGTKAAQWSLNTGQNPPPRGSSYGGHLNSCNHRWVTKGGVAAALATSVKWGKQLVWPSVADQ